MNRIPQYRAWIIAEKRMVFTYINEQEQTADYEFIESINPYLKRIVLNRVKVKGGSFSYSQYWLPFSEIILMESTGYEDIHKKELWEGDIISVDAAPSGCTKEKDIKEYRGEIIWDRNRWTVVLSINGERWAIGKLCWSTAEYLGNIHQNPELLEAQE